MKKNLLLILLPALMLAGCGKKDEDNANPNDPGQQQGQGEGEGGGSGGSGGEREIVSTLITYGDSYEAKFTNGTQFGSDHANNVTDLKNYLNAQAEKDDLITSLDCISCNSLDDLNKDGSGNRYFTIGSAKVGGSIKINSKYKISKVEVGCINYNNTYTSGGGGYNCDRESHLLIDTQDNSLEIGQSETPVAKTFSLEYETPVRSFKLSTLDAEYCRVFIKTITLTYTA